MMKSKFVNKQKEAEGTYSFIFNPARPIRYLPGQYMYFTLYHKHFNDPRGSTRHFTVSSSPSEGENVMLTTRVRAESQYKQALYTLKNGDEVEIEGPTGTFIIDEHEKNHNILIAGGIGVTPFRSIIKYKMDHKIRNNTQLIYSCSTVEDIIFQQELETWARQDKSVKLDITVTQPNKSKAKWMGLTGRIDETMLRKLVPSELIYNSTYWVSGPPVMVDAIEDTLYAMDIKIDNIITDKFTGY